MSDFSNALLRQQHGVIEASAGTGKTYTIQELAVRLVKSGVPLPGILILTYTEAATSELRQRILAALRREASGESERARVRKALNEFDAAAIHTIHGFCQRVLMRYAFENQQHFALEVIDDLPIYRRCLREEQRRHWPQLLGAGFGQEALADFLALNGYPGGEKNAWETVVLEIARNWRPQLDELFPAPPVDLADLAAAACRKIEPVRRALLDFLQAPQNSALTIPLFERQLQQFQCLSSRLQKALREYIVEPLCGGGPAGDPERLMALATTLRPTGRAFPEKWWSKGFACLQDDAWTKAKKNQEAALSEQNKRLEQLVAALSELDGLRQFFGCLGAFAASRLRRKVDAFKEAHGLISFEDMLTRLERALDPAQNPAAPQLLQALRTQYQVALVDEFQDTDPVQWSILRRIFIGDKDEKLAQRLFVIGDPKQAIYGFRGADVTVYLQACQYVRNIQAAGSDTNSQSGNGLSVPAAHRLDCSYRSTPDLLAALNRLFQVQDSWFGPASGIPYTPVAPPLEGGKVELHYPAKERAAVNLVDLSGARSASAARKDMARFVAGEIARLLDWRGAPGKDRLSFIAERHGEKKERGLEAGDIAILVDARRTAALFERALDEYRFPIPHTFYKKEGLYRSDEATHLSILFQAIADPADHAAFRKALLTHFFRVAAEDLVEGALSELPPEHPIKRLFEHWRYFAQRRNWARLFQSVLEDTGVLWSAAPWYRLENAGDPPHCPPDTERRGTNYQHILEELEDAARREHLDFAGVCERLEARRQGLSTGGEDSGLHRLETEDPKVRIMTIHASKGLEFPVVFVCAGFTENKAKRPFTKYHRRDAGGLRQSALVYDLSPGRHNDWQAEEQREETSRLYYVALTRAQCLLYAPYLPPDKESGGKLKAGAACTLLYPAMKAAWEDKYDGTTVCSVPARDSSTVPNALTGTLQTKNAITGTLQTAPEGWLDPLGPDRVYITAADTVQSFSALSRSRGSSHPILAGGGGGREPALLLGDDKPRDWDEKSAPPAPQRGLTPISSLEMGSLSPLASDVLPSGQETGLALHEVLEQVDFRTVREAAAWEELLQAPQGAAYRNLLVTAIEKHGLSAKRSDTPLASDPYSQTLTRLVWNCLRAKLPDFPGGALRLCDLDDRDFLRELEFNLPLPAWRDLASNGSWEDCKRALRAARPALKLKDPPEHATGYLNGVIDMVFRSAAPVPLAGGGWGRGPCRYYVLDWKSNLLQQGYGQAELTACMRESSYDLQSRIYSLALLRWLAQCRIPADQFGGVYYVFLRGVDAANPSAGFFKDFAVPRNEDLSAELFVRLNGQEEGGRE